MFEVHIPERTRPRIDLQIKVPPQRLLEKLVLRVDEAAYVLNLGRRTIYDWVDEGKLDKVRGGPVRVTTESVKRWLEIETP